MDSQAVILTPAQLVFFADSLDDSLKRLRSKGKRLEEIVAAARAVWKDEKYEAFHKHLIECQEELARFNTAGNRHVEFLREKAELGNKYLRRS